MPLYDFKCKQGHTFERQVPLKDFEATQHCDCLAPAIRLISSPRFSVDKTGYNCPVTGKWIGSGREHRENLRRQGCRVLEAGETEAAAAYRKAADDEFDKKVEDTVEREVEKMSSEKKEELYTDLTRKGVDIAYERGIA